MEILIEANSRLTNILTKARNHSDIDDDLLHEYNDGLECIESSMYPNERKLYLRQSHKNLIEIMKQEVKYYNMIERVNAGDNIIVASDSSSSSSEDNVLKKDSLDKTEHLRAVKENEVLETLENL